MQYLLHGQIFEAIPKQYNDKKTGAVTREFIEVTVEQTVLDGNGFRVKDLEKVNFPMEDYDVLRNSIDKYITVPFEFRTWRDATTKQQQSAMMKSDGANHVIYDKNPFPNKPKDNPTKVKEVPTK